ncbi:hypothetical protein SEMRO_2786_G337030.1 [Seminavis robusta]|uniref:Uncharacterized protein n=1 Tax=Seminavis robusta TaxID=568900 RepID=A0A9N8HY85_9STRA|nr:hypothetical protein SEMRO_2786_G337030.1 [Seminavis robusta]|eukprot:Sro2786_g337030.1 n/a (564) ;mRNA; r:850-2884
MREDKAKEMDLDEVLVEDDIREEENAIKDIRDFSALEKSNKTLSALNYCNHFLKSYCKKEGIRYHRLEDIEFGGIDKSGNPFWDKMIASFLHYLGSTAKRNFDDSNDGLSYQTATQYASAVKQFVVNQFRLEDRISVFRDEQWRVLRKQLLSMYKENCRKNGKALVNGHEGSSDDDRVAIGTACIWVGDQRSAQFLAFDVTKYYAAGRCREISLLEVKHLTLKQMDENGRTFHVLPVKVDRDKQGGSQILPLFRPHWDHMQQDVYFAFAYNLLVNSSVDMGIVGGEPPNIHDIRGEENLWQARIVCSCLFKDDWDGHWSPAIREVLFASVLIFYPDLIELLGQHPSSKYQNLKSHPFVCVLLHALEAADVPVRRFHDWCADVRKGFLQRNCIALPINMLARNGYDGLNEIQVDARSFLTQMNALTRAYIPMSNHVVSIGEDLRRVIDRHDKLERMLVQFMESDTNNKHEDDECERLAYSDIVLVGQPKTPARLFISFFKDSYHVLYYNQLKTKQWKCLSQQERGKVSTCFRRQKRCVRHMLCFLCSFPSAPPKIGQAYTDWLS